MPTYYVQRLSPLQFSFWDSPPDIFSRWAACSEKAAEVLALAENRFWEGPLEADSWKSALMSHYKIGPQYCVKDDCYDWILCTCRLSTNDYNDEYNFETGCGGEKGDSFCLICDRGVRGCERCKDFDASYFLAKDRSGNIKIVKGCLGLFNASNQV